MSDRSPTPPPCNRKTPTYYTLRIVSTSHVRMLEPSETFPVSYSAAFYRELITQVIDRLDRPLSIRRAIRSMLYAELASRSASSLAPLRQEDPPKLTLIISLTAALQCWRLTIFIGPNARKRQYPSVSAYCRTGQDPRYVQLTLPAICRQV